MIWIYYETCDKSWSLTSCRVTDQLIERQLARGFKVTTFVSRFHRVNELFQTDHKQFGMTLFYLQTISKGFGEVSTLLTDSYGGFPLIFWKGLLTIYFREIVWQRCCEMFLDLLRRCSPDVLGFFMTFLYENSWRFYVEFLDHLDHQDFPADVPLRPSMPPNTAPASARTPRTVSVRWDGGWSGELLLQRWKCDYMTADTEYWWWGFHKEYSSLLFEPPVFVCWNRTRHYYWVTITLLFAAVLNTNLDTKHHRHVGKASNRSPWKNMEQQYECLQTWNYCYLPIYHIMLTSFWAGKVFRVWEQSTYKQMLICPLSIFATNILIWTLQTCGRSIAIASHCQIEYLTMLDEEHDTIDWNCILHYICICKYNSYIPC